MMNTPSPVFIPHRPSRGSPRGAHSSGTLAGCDKLATVSKPNKDLVLTKKAGLRVCTFNVRTLNDTGAASLLVRELSRLKIGIAGLQEVRWIDSGEMSVDGCKVLWSGRQDGKRADGVGLVIQGRLIPCMLEWHPVSERLLRARFRHMHGYLSVVVCYAPTEDATEAVKDTFYGQLDDVLRGVNGSDLLVCLGDFNAVSGTQRQPSDVTLGPLASGSPNDNSERFLAICRKNVLRIAGSWYRRKDIHRMSWYSNDGRTKKEIDHVLVNTKWRSL